MAGSLALRLVAAPLHPSPISGPCFLCSVLLRLSKPLPVRSGLLRNAGSFAPSLLAVRSSFVLAPTGKHQQRDAPAAGARADFLPGLPSTPLGRPDAARTCGNGH